MSGEERSESRRVDARWLSPARRTKVSVGLITVGLIVLFQHLFSHMGFFRVLPGSMDDVIIGYPTAGVLVIAGLMMLGGDGERSRR